MGALTMLRVLILLMLVAGLIADPFTSAEASTAGPPRLASSWGVNGPVYAVAVLGGTVFVGGDFTAATSATGATLPRHNLAAFSLRTGQPLRTWVANTSDAVHALATADGSVWVGGKFASVNGIRRSHLAEVSAVDGQVGAFRLDVNQTVRALAVADGRLYAGGDFTLAAGAKAPHLLAAQADTGRRLRSFRGAANGTVWSLAVGPQRQVLYVGGLFSRLSHRPRASIGAMDADTGAIRRPVFRQSSGPILGLDVSRNGTHVIAAVGGSPERPAGNSIASWNARTGARTWRVRLRGDGQAVDVLGRTVYAGFHHGYRNDTRARLLAIDVATGRVHPRFRPSFNEYFGVRSIAATRQGIAVGGEFTTVNGTVHDGLAVFRTPQASRSRGRRNH